MFINVHYMNIGVILLGEEHDMATAKPRAHKHFQLNTGKLKRAQRVLRAETETETIERALDIVIAEHERNRVTRDANERFVRSRIHIKDVYGNLDK